MSRQSAGAKYYPPIDFRVLGMDSLSGTRWLSFFDLAAEKIAAIRLAYVTDRRDGYALVETANRVRVGGSAGNARPARETAWRAAWLLANLTRPTAPADVARLVGDRLPARIDAVADRWATWERVTWTVDEVPTAAMLWRFAGGWVGVSDEISDVYLTVAGEGSLHPEGARFTTLANCSEYGFNLDQAFSIGVLSEIQKGHPLRNLPIPLERPIHSDHQQLLDIRSISS